MILRGREEKKKKKKGQIPDPQRESGFDDDDYTRIRLFWSGRHDPYWEGRSGARASYSLALLLSQDQLRNFVSRPAKGDVTSHLPSKESRPLAFSGIFRDFHWPTFKIP